MNYTYIYSKLDNGNLIFPTSFLDYCILLELNIIESFLIKMETLRTAFSTDQ